MRRQRLTLHCTPAPRAFCQSQSGKDTGREEGGGTVERSAGSKQRIVPVEDQNRQKEEVGGSGNNGRDGRREKGRQE